MTNEKAIMCLEDMRIKVPIPKAAKQARENNEALDVAIKALAESELSTNLAEVGTDCISRQQAIDDIWTVSPLARLDRKWVDRWLRQLPSAQPEIIRCRECKFASGDSRICMKFDHSPIGELDFCSFAERREVNNESD